MFERSSAEATYLSEISAHPVLTREEEAELARRWRDDRDPAAAERLITSNLRFVVRVAHKYRGYGARLLDLVQEGNMGLIRAVDRYDPDRGVRLISYAVWWIRAYIQSYILRSWSLVKLGTTHNQRKLFFSLAKARREAATEAGFVSDEDLAERLGVSEAEIAELSQRISSRDTSLSTPVNEAAEMTLGDFVPDQAPLPSSTVSDREGLSQLTQRIEHAAAGLDDRERYILRHRLLAEEPLRLTELGRHFGISRERARQLELRAKRKLRVQLSDLRDFLTNEGPPPPSLQA